MKAEELQLKILEWKEQYEEVYQVNLVDEEREYIFTFIFHTLGREEYKDLITDDIDEVKFQEIICDAAVLYPEGYDFSNGLAGIAEVLSDIIVEESGLHIGQAKNILDRYREQMMIYDYQADCLIHEAFPEFTIEQIQSWSNKKTMYYLSRSEWILINLRGVPLVSLDQQVNEDMAQHMQQQQHQHHFESSSPSRFVSQEEMPPEFQEQFKSFEEPVPQEEGKKGAQSEQELMAMLGQGSGVNSPHKGKFEEVYPELAWFEHEDQLKGNYD